MQENDSILKTQHQEEHSPRGCMLRPWIDPIKFTDACDQ